MVPKGRSEAAMTETQTLYDKDFVAWSKQQAEALRAAARAGPNLRLDWENLAEEVESLGASERRALHGQVQRVIRHLLKLEYSTAVEPRRGWIETVTDARSEIEIVWKSVPACGTKSRPWPRPNEIADRGLRSAISRNMARSLPRELRRSEARITRSTKSSAIGFHRMPPAGPRRNDWRG
jgi:hypothetical protein